MSLLRLLLFIAAVVLKEQTSSASQTCAKKSFESNSFVCVCNSTHCDFIEPISPQNQGTYLLYTSDATSHRFTKRTGRFVNSTISGASSLVVNIDRNAKHQKIFGWGGAFTDSTGINLLSLNAETRTKLLESYFGNSGIEYNFGRVPIGGTDFSTRGYSYDDGPEDLNLENFNLTGDDFIYKIAFINEANKIKKHDLKLIAEAWTAPKWIKSNGEYTGGTIKEGYLQIWANYHLKFLESYAKEGIKFWAISTGNEPSTATTDSPVNSVGYSVKDMIIWIGDHLGPTIKSSAFNMTKIMTLSDHRYFLPSWPLLVITDKVAKYVEGLGVHWYFNELYPPVALDLTHQFFPNLFIMATESCAGFEEHEPPVVLGSWHRAEKYAHAIIEDLSHNGVGWIDWNMALNITGGPTYVSNRVDCTILVNAEKQEFYKQPTFYAIGHFSKFIPEGSVRISSGIMSENLEIIAFERPDQGIVVVVHNRNEVDRIVIIRGSINKEIELVINAKSINTLIFW